MPGPLEQFVRARLLADEKSALELRTRLLAVIARHDAAGSTAGSTPDAAGTGGTADDAVARRSLECVDGHLAALNTLVRLTDLHAGCRPGRPCRVDVGEELGPLAWGLLGNEEACATLLEMARRYHEHPDFDAQWLPQAPEQAENSWPVVPLERPRP